MKVPEHAHTWLHAPESTPTISSPFCSPLTCCAASTEPTVPSIVAPVAQCIIDTAWLYPAAMLAVRRVKRIRRLRRVLEPAHHKAINAYSIGDNPSKDVPQAWQAEAARAPSHTHFSGHTLA